MNQANRNTIVLRRISFVVLCWTMMAAMAFTAAAAASVVTSGNASGPLSGVVAALGTIALIRRIGASRVILGKSELKMVNPLFTYRIPYHHVMEADTSGGGTLTVRTFDNEEFYSAGFGGSLLDHFIGSSGRAAERINETVRKRRVPRTEEQPRRTLTISWIADLCLFGAICVAGWVLLASG